MDTFSYVYLCIHVQIHIYQKLSGSIQSLKVSHRVVKLDILTLEKADPFRANQWILCWCLFAALRAQKLKRERSSDKAASKDKAVQSQRRSVGATWKFMIIQITCYTLSTNHLWTIKHFASIILLLGIQASGNEETYFRSVAIDSGAACLAWHSLSQRRSA